MFSAVSLYPDLTSLFMLFSAILFYSVLFVHFPEIISFVRVGSRYSDVELELCADAHNHRMQRCKDYSNRVLCYINRETHHIIEVCRPLRVFFCYEVDSATWTESRFSRTVSIHTMDHCLDQTALREIDYSLHYIKRSLRSKNSKSLKSLFCLHSAVFFFAMAAFTHGWSNVRSSNIVTKLRFHLFQIT